MMIIKAFTMNGLKYIISYPDGYEENRKYPVVFFFHGAGGRGDDLGVLKNNPYFQITKKHKAFPFITIAPLCSKNSWFDLFDAVKVLILKMINEPFVDLKRVYAIGASMGGYCTWQLAMSMPEVFAAIIPICGGGMYWNAGRLKNVHVWAFHGEKDTLVLPEESINMTKRVIEEGGSAKLTLYPQNGHDAWSDTYSNWEVFVWLLQQENKNETNLIELYNDSKMYG